MSQKIIRLIILLATISITGILVIQVFWLKRAFDLREKQFTLNVNLALKNVVESLCNYNGIDYPGQNPVEKLASNYFVVNINNMIDPQALEYFLKAEFEKRAITAGFEYGIYDCADEQMVYGDIVNMEEPLEENGQKAFPTLERNEYYFGVYFPDRPADMAGQMGIWIFSTVVLLIVVIYFTYTLYVILKQRRLSEIQRDFINNMTHEFKTPLSTIAISTGVLKDPAITSQPERLMNYATIIENENSRLQNQVERVLQMATLEKEEIHLKREATDMGRLIREVVDRVAIHAEEANPEINLELKATNHMVVGDRLHLANIIFNLIDNGIKYCRMQPIIQIKSQNERQTLIIEVKDNGIGIASKEQKRIFEKFYRVPTGNLHDVKGFGIGLNYVELVVKAHKGSISLDSAPGSGSTFTIRLPLSN